MAEFNALTAEETETRLGLSVVSGTINGSGHLILTRANGEEIDAGDFTGIVTGILTEQVNDQIDAELPDAVAGTVVDWGAQNGSLATDFDAFNSDTIINALIKLQLTGNATIDVADMPSSPKPGTQFAMRFLQDATGSRTLTLTGFKKSQGVLTLTTTAGAIDIVVFMYDGGNWYAGLMGVDFK